MKISRRLIAVLFAGAIAAAALHAQETPVVAPAGADLSGVWHLGRVTGDLERIIHFYHDVLGLDFRGERDAPIPFYSVATINEFVNAPGNAEFRAAFMPIPGASRATEPQAQIYLEAFEYRHIDRRLEIPALTDLGVSTLRFLVRDLDETLAAAAAADIAIVTAGGVPVRGPAPPGYSGSARAIMVRDPDGYPVELVELTPAPPTLAPESSPIIGAQMTVVVADAAAALRFYGDLIGSELHVLEAVSDWRNGAELEQLRNVAELEYRTASFVLPDSAIALELIELRNVDQARYRPVFQDIGFGHVAFTARDIEIVAERMDELGIDAISAAGTWTQINESTRAVYTRDPDGFFVEILERR